MNWFTILWLALLIVFLMTEASTVALVSVWFAMGALAAMITAILGGKLWLQVTLFIVVSGVCLAALRPVARKLFDPKKRPTNLDAVIGSQGVVLEQIDNVRAVGRVKLGTMEWSARSTNGQPIAVGTQVTVDKIEGVKVFVTPVPVTVN